jgi:hypothetical protein
VASGGRVCVGNFNANGLNVNDDNDDNDYDNIGRALAWNFCLPFYFRVLSHPPSILPISSISS